MNYNNLKDVRTSRGMSISELSRRANLSRITISNIEKGYSNPSIKTVAKICKVLGKNPNEIFFDYFVNHEVQSGATKEI